MGYPVRYRDARPQMPSRPAPRPSATILRFPHRFRRGVFGAPTRLGGRATFGLRPPYRPTPPIMPVPPALGGRLIPALGLALTAWQLLDGMDYQPAFGPVPITTWGTVCGPEAYPGPPYRNQVHWRWLAPTSTTPFCGLGGQAVSSVDNAPSPGDQSVFTYWGPNELLLPLERYYVRSQQSGDSAELHAQGFQAAGIVPAPYVAGFTPSPVPNDWSVPVPPPVWVTPYIVPSVWPDAPFRSDGVNDTVDLVRPYPAPPVRDTIGDVTQVRQPEPPRRPPVRERERKMDSTSRVGRAVLWGFRALQTYGAVNSFVDAFWRAIPAAYRTPRAGIFTKYRELWANFHRIEFDDAFRNAFVAWVRYRIAAFAYGAAFQGARNLVPGNENVGIRIYRGMATANTLGDHDWNIRRAANLQPGKRWSTSKQRRRRWRRMHRKLKG